MNDLIPFEDVQKMAKILGNNKMFGKTPDELLPLMLIAQAEGKHPATVAMEYDVIKGKPALNAKTAQARFQGSGGKIKWIERTDKIVTAEFTHPIGGELTISWTWERATKAGLTTKPSGNDGPNMWQRFPAQMMTARVIAEGVRTLWPSCLSNMYTSEEVMDMDDLQPLEPRNVTPGKEDEQEKDPDTGPDVKKEITALALKIAKILGAKNDPNGWTEKERLSLDLRGLLDSAKESVSITPAEVALLRAEIADKYRGDAGWDKLVADLVGCGLEKEKLESIKAQLAGLAA